MGGGEALTRAGGAGPEANRSSCVHTWAKQSRGEQAYGSIRLASGQCVECIWSLSGLCTSRDDSVGTGCKAHPVRTLA